MMHGHGAKMDQESHLSSSTQPPARESFPHNSPRNDMSVEGKTDDVTKVKFARFVFNGVNTTVLSTSSKSLDDANRSQDVVENFLKSPRQSQSSSNRDENDEEAPEERARSKKGFRRRLEFPSDGSDHAGFHQLCSDSIKKVSDGAVGQEFMQVYKKMTRECEEHLQQTSMRDAESLQTFQLRSQAVSRIMSILFELRDSSIELTTEESRRSKEYEIEVTRSELNQLRAAEEGMPCSSVTGHLKIAFESSVATAQRIGVQSGTRSNQAERPLIHVKTCRVPE
mmetsp:Transcript_28626/g.92339  ORF Transcript_28626/g.92339 Transcript_28626/m.92339 type:complete len:282 (+) Transcript_28626:293-1138(+)